MPRGRVWAIYVKDDGITGYARLVDADHALDAPRGWSTLDVGSYSPIPTGFKPRYVAGISPTTGRRGTAVIASLSADLWTGAVTNFEVEANDGTIDVMTVVGKYGEREPFVS